MLEIDVLRDYSPRLYGVLRGEFWELGVQKMPKLPAG